MAGAEPVVKPTQMGRFFVYPKQRSDRKMRKILFPILAIALAVGLALPMAAPAAALPETTT